MDWLLAASNAGMVVLWLRLASEYAAAWWFAAIHLVAAALPLLLRLAPSPRGTVARSLWSAYPLGFLAVFWSELDLHGRLVSTTSFDAAVVRLDRAAFGVHVNQAWLAAMHGPVFSEIMHLLYLSYYVLLIGVPALLLLSASERLIQDGVLRITLAYLVCFTMHAWWPTIGPEMLGVTFPPSVRAGLFFRVSHWILARETPGARRFPAPTSPRQ